MSALNPGLHLSATTVLKEGLRDSITFGVAFIFLYVSIGILGATQSLSLSQTLATTLLIFSTPLQFLLMQSYQDGWILIDRKSVV